MIDNKILRFVTGLVLGFVGMLPNYPDPAMFIAVFVSLMILLAFVDGIVYNTYHKINGYNPYKAVVFVIGVIIGMIL